VSKAESRADEVAARVMRDESLSMIPALEPTEWDQLTRGMQSDWIAILRRVMAVREQELLAVGKGGK